MTRSDDFSPSAAALVAAAHRAAARGLTPCSSGNISLRSPDGSMLISASRSWLADLTADQVVTIDLASGERRQGPVPSVEHRFHLGIMRKRPHVRVVLHFQSPFATRMACDARDAINYNVLPEVPYYIGTIATVPYITPGSPELADAVIDACSDHNLAVLRSHGLVTVGTSADDAIQRAVFFELACSVMVRGGDQVKRLTPAAVGELTNAGLKARMEARNA